MSFEKRITSASFDEENLKTADKKTFPKKFKFASRGKVWVVIESFKSGSEEWRRIKSVDGGDDEVMQLSVLQKDALSADFKPL